MTGSWEAPQISLLIPTFADRSAFLARSLRYYSETRFPYPILVADSSEPRSQSRNSDLVAELQARLEIHHRSYPQDWDGHHKIADALASLVTPYVVLCGDDDFLLADAVETCVRFLDANPDFAAADGQEIKLFTSDAAQPGTDPRGVSHRQVSIEAEDPAHRLREHFAHYWPSFYSVHRRSLIIGNLLGASEGAAASQFVELLQSGLTMIQGKYKHFDTLYMVRQVNHSELHTPNWDEMLRAPSFRAQEAAVVAALAQELGPDLGPMRERERLAQQAVQGFMKPIRRWMQQSSVRAKVRWTISLFPALVRSALLEGQLFDTLRSPRRVLHRCSAQRDAKQQAKREGPWSVSSLRERDNEFYEQFNAIFECVRTWPRGIDPGMDRAPEYRGTSR